MKVSLLILTLGVSQAATFIHKSLSPSMFAFYPLEYLLNASVPYTIIALLPKFVAVSCGQLPGSKYKKP